MDRRAARARCGGAAPARAAAARRGAARARRRRRGRRRGRRRSSASTRMSRLWRKAVPSAAVAAISTRQPPGASGGVGGVAGRGLLEREGPVVAGGGRPPDGDGERRGAHGLAVARRRCARRDDVRLRGRAPTVQPSASWAARSRSKLLAGDVAVRRRRGPEKVPMAVTVSTMFGIEHDEEDAARRSARRGGRSAAWRGAHGCRPWKTRLLARLRGRSRRPRRRARPASAAVGAGRAVGGAGQVDALAQRLVGRAR